MRAAPGLVIFKFALLIGGACFLVAWIAWSPLNSSDQESTDPSVKGHIGAIDKMATQLPPFEYPPTTMAIPDRKWSRVFEIVSQLERAPAGDQAVLFQEASSLASMCAPHAEASDSDSCKWLGEAMKKATAVMTRPGISPDAANAFGQHYLDMLRDGEGLLPDARTHLIRAARAAFTQAAKQGNLHGEMMLRELSQL